jgi:hypothetical protein
MGEKWRYTAAIICNIILVGGVITSAAVSCSNNCHAFLHPYHYFEGCTVGQIGLKDKL